jgi:hypothetical protein
MIDGGWRIWKGIFQGIDSCFSLSSEGSLSAITTTKTTVNGYLDFSS